MSYQEVQSILGKIENPAFVSPVSPFVVGRKAFYWGISLPPKVPAEVREGWRMAFGKCAEAVAVDDPAAALSFVEAVGS